MSSGAIYPVRVNVLAQGDVPGWPQQNVRGTEFLQGPALQGEPLGTGETPTSGQYNQSPPHPLPQTMYINTLYRI